ncbi:MAG: MATE family efflux transporter [Balneolaceae bacterium]|nr:MATE family efflux transporter [Balneolaceae bacterium]MBO6545956.1 MATE family efflux transporter [Balneolaceae bacterium]MBO6647352.1 MATE family efflux transporter [Balneolaceae bacterium]
MGLNVTDTIMAGQLSAADLAGVAVGNALYLPVTLFGMATLVAINPIVSQYLGARKFFEIGKSVRQMLWLIFFLAIPSFFVVRNLDFIMHLVKVDPEIIPLSSKYLKAVAWGIPGLLIFAGLRYFSEGLAITKPAMYLSFLMLLLNIPADYVLMYGKLGFPAMGAEGTGYATTVVQLASAITMVIFAASFKPFKRFNIFARTRGPEWRYIKELLYVGLPNGASSTLEVLLFASVSVLMGTLSVTASAAHQISISIAATVFMIPFGLSMAISQRVGLAAGQGSIEKARFRGFVGTAICTLIMVFTAVLIFTIPDPIVGIYTSDPDVKKLAVSLVFMAGLFQISDGLQVGGFGALRGLKDTRVPMVVNFISYWLIGFSVGYYLGIHTHLGPKGLWIGLISGLSVAAILHNLRFHLLTKNA